MTNIETGDLQIIVASPKPYKNKRNEIYAVGFHLLIEFRLTVGTMLTNIPNCRLYNGKISPPQIFNEGAKQWTPQVRVNRTLASAIYNAIQNAAEEERWYKKFKGLPELLPLERAVAGLLADEETLNHQFPGVGTMAVGVL